MPPLSSFRPALRAAHTRARSGPSMLPKFHVPLSAYVVDCAVYVDGVRVPGRFTHERALAEVRRRDEGFVWIGLHEPAEEQITGIADVFGLHELAVEDAVHAHQRPKLERYDDTLFMVLKTVRYCGAEDAQEVVETGEVMVFLGRDFVITVRHGNHSGLARLRRELDEDPERLQLGPSAVVHAITDHVVDHYLDVTGRIETDIDEMEAQVFAPRSPVSAEQIYLMKREVLELRRAVTPLATPLRRLSEGYITLVPEDVRSYFRDVEDHLTTVSEHIASFDELLSTLIDAALAKITLQQNTDMRKITAWAAIISIPTMIAGIYGMNFEDMPELHWRFGYPYAIGLMVAITIALYMYFRRRDWL